MNDPRTLDIIRRMNAAALAGRHPTTVVHEAIALMDALRVERGLPAITDPSTLPGYREVARRMTEAN